MFPENSPLAAALRKVIDPEIGINIVDLGLVYGLHQAGDDVSVDLTMTSPACPLGETIIADIEHELIAVLPEGANVHVNLVWDPPWSPARMSDRARETLGWAL